MKPITELQCDICGRRYVDLPILGGGPELLLADTGEVWCSNHSPAEIKALLSIGRARA